MAIICGDTSMCVVPMIGCRCYQSTPYVHNYSNNDWHTNVLKLFDLPSTVWYLMNNSNPELTCLNNACMVTGVDGLIKEHDDPFT